MTDAKHAPAPWVEELSPEGYWSVWGGIQLSLCAAQCGPDQNAFSAKNARLIAAAPDLLDALESAQALLNPMSGFIKRGDAKAQKYLENQRDMIRAAITRAKGGK